MTSQLGEGKTGVYVSQKFPFAYDYADGDNDALADSALLASLDDMVVLRPDVVNLSLGWAAGMDNEADSVFSSVFKKLQDEGISVNAAAGNHYSAGYGNTSGRNLPHASDPDSST